MKVKTLKPPPPDPEKAARDAAKYIEEVSKSLIMLARKHRHFKLSSALEVAYYEAGLRASTNELTLDDIEALDPRATGRVPNRDHTTHV